MSRLKVIMIGETSSYIRSAMLEMVLTNDPKGFSFGGVWSLFMPREPQQLDTEFPKEEDALNYWQHVQTDLLELKGNMVKHLLIWKTPKELAKVFGNRNSGKILMTKWLDYQRQYCSFIEDFRVVRYSNLVNNPDTLKNLCGFFGVGYFLDKREFWSK